MEQEDRGVEDELERDLQRLVSLAARVAQTTPEFRERAFDRVLDFLLLHQASTTGARKISKEARAARRTPKVNSEALDRIGPIMNAPPELASEYPELIDLDAKAKIYALLSISRGKFGIDGLTMPELRAVANDKFRIGIPDGTLRGTLSRAPATEVGRAPGKGDETLYRLLLPGESYLKTARERLASKKGS